MKKYITTLMLSMLILPVFAAGRSTIGDTNSSRVVVAPANFKSSLKFDNSVPSGSVNAAGTNTEKVAVVDDDPRPAVDRERERMACISNNIGVGNTFVWASRDSNIGSYASMVEDTQNPENNVCWVRVELKSNNPKVNVSDFDGQYFKMGDRITCGSWADEEKLEKRILDAKKTARTLATIGGAVGGAGIGVGAMELFGNQMIGGKVMGQQNENLSETQLLKSQLIVLKGSKDQDKQTTYKTIINQLKIIKQECDAMTSKTDDCARYDYNELLSVEK